MKTTMMRKGVWRSAKLGLLYLFHALHITNHPFPCLVVLKLVTYQMEHVLKRPQLIFNANIVRSMIDGVCLTCNGG